MSTTRSQWRVILPLGLAVGLSLPGDQTLYAVLPNHAAALGVSVGAVGVLLGANRLIRIPGNWLAGALYDRQGRRRLFLLGLFLGAISSASYGLAQGFWPLLAGRLLWGASWSLINVGGLVMTLDVSSEADRGRWIGVYQAFFLLGLAFSPLLGGFLTDALGFRRALFICASISIGGWLLAVLGLPETRPLEQATQPKLIQPPGRWADRRVLAAACVYLLTLFTGSGVLMSTIGLYLGQRFGDEVPLGGLRLGVATLSGLALALRSALSMLAGPAVGSFSDWRGERWTAVWGGALLGALGFALLAVGASLGGVVGGMALVAVGGAALTTALPALVGDAATDGRQGQAIGALTTAGDIGSASGPLLAYALLAVVDLRWVYLLCAVALLAGLTIVKNQVR